MTAYSTAFIRRSHATRCLQAGDLTGIRSSNRHRIAAAIPTSTAIMALILSPSFSLICADLRNQRQKPGPMRKSAAVFPTLAIDQGP